MYQAKDPSDQIAVIGMSGEFPGSENIDLYWENLREGQNLVKEIPLDEHKIEPWTEQARQKSSYIPFKGFLDKSTEFDADLFEYTPREAAFMDPQQRKLLHHSWAALENAGYNPDAYEGLISVFACSSISSYFYFNVLSHVQQASSHSSDEMLGVIGNDKDFIATRISYKLNLKGPSQTVQTACSSSLVALHNACQSLLNFESDIALVAAASITFPLYKGYHFIEEGIGSKDGKCRPFDINSSGTVSGNGACVVVLKRFDEAIKDHDTISGVIRGSAINNDGSHKVGYTAPSVEGQANVIAAAHMSAEVSPEDISYIETHGTATQLGDSIEIAALRKAFERSRPTNITCALGSVKANIGHLDAASGLAGFIKTVLCLQNKTLPPLVHFSKPNPKLEIASTPFFFPSSPMDWKTENTPRIAGISSFGIGGTNAHVIIEEPPLVQKQKSQKHYHVIPLSAKNESKLRELIIKYIEFIETTKHDIADIAFTLQVGRKSLPEKTVFFCSSVDELKRKLKSFLQNDKEDLESYQEDPDFYLSQKWVNHEFDIWPELYLNEKRQRVPLPSYPFSDTEFFLHPEPVNQSKTAPEEPVQGTLDEEIKKIWMRVLKITEISDDATFFTLGGDSLLALELIEDIRSLCFVEIKIKDLFEYASLKDFTEFVYQTILNHANDLNPVEAEKILELI